MEDRYQGFQLFQRGVRLKSLSEGLKNKLRSPIRELFDEWQTGFAFTSAITEQMERELMAKLEPGGDIPDVQDLWYFEESEDVGDWLGRHGWDVTVTKAEDLMASYDRTPPDVEDSPPQTLFVAAERTGEN